MAFARLDGERAVAPRYSLERIAAILSSFAFIRYCICVLYILILRADRVRDRAESQNAPKSI
ncbi:MAG: hypothetical protein LBQ52_06245 [Helicobacteraceae bacterium]|jgi:phytoene/squalene synthetase|nr:hypothetical protein [Helicobacteraceae bacterium]